MVSRAFQRATSDPVAIASAATPPGTIAAFFLSDAPGGWLKADGSAVSRTTYADLFAAIGTMFGTGNGSTTFNLPDLRGEFVRGLDGGRGVDSGRALGSAQDEGVGVHNHTASTTIAGKSAGTPSGSISTDGAHTHTVPLEKDGSGASVQSTNEGGKTLPTSSAGAHTHTFTGSALPAHDHTASTTVNNSAAGESRPRNIAALMCIKA